MMINKLIIIIALLSIPVSASAKIGLRTVYLEDGTRCLIATTEALSPSSDIECDWKYGQLLAVLKEQQLKIRLLQQKLRRNKWLLVDYNSIEAPSVASGYLIYPVF